MAEQVPHGRCHPRRFDLRRHILKPAHGRLRAQGITALRRPANRQLEQRVLTKTIAIAGIFIPPGNCQHPEQQHLVKLMADPGRIAAIPHALRQTS